MAAVRHLGIIKLIFSTANHFRVTIGVIALNFVEIGRNVAAISHFSRFSSEMKKITG